MSDNRLRLDGLAELKAALRALPAELAAEAGEIAVSHANQAAQAMEAKYRGHRRTGHLADGVTVKQESAGAYGVSVVVKNTAKHAHLFEVGTQARHTALGANRGSMPAGHVFVPIMIRERRAMYEDDKALLIRHGLTVSGDP